MKYFALIILFLNIGLADDLAKKKVLIGDLKNKEFDLKKNHNQTIPKLPKIEAFCLKEDTTVEACKAKVEAAMNRVQNKSQVLSNVKERGKVIERLNERRER